MLGAGVLLFLVLADRPADPLVAGAPAPDFRLPRLEGGEPLGLADLRGRVVLLNFWATWCQPCEDEMPAMERLYRRLHGLDFEMLAVSVDEEAEKVLEFQRRLGVGFPILLDPRARVAKAYQTTGYPESFLIDRDGKIVFKYVGPREWDLPVYEARIRRLLAPAAEAG